MPDIVHFGKFYPPDFGGIELVTRQLAEGLAATGRVVDVVAFAHHAPEGEVAEKGVHIHRFAPALSLASQPVGLGYVRACVRLGGHARIIHVHLPNMLAALACLRVGNGPGKEPAIVVHWHSDVVGKGRLAALVAPLERMVLNRASRIIATSQAYAEASAALRPFLSKTDVIPIGIDPPKGLPQRLSPEIAGFVAGRRMILSVGRLIGYKGFDVLVSAATGLPEDVAVVIAGEGPLRETLSRQIRALGLEDKVLLAGRLSEPDLAGLFAAAELFCLPSVSRAEAFGVVLEEAMAHGLPVVATAIPGSGTGWVNQHGESGLNVVPGDAVALAAACGEILSSPSLLKRFAQGARARYTREFTAELMISRTADLYDRLA